MGNRFASGKIAIAECDRCGQQYRLKQLKTEIIKQRKYELLVCPTCWDPDQPQLMLGTFPVDDPQALRNPRKDTTYVTSGVNVNGKEYSYSKKGMAAAKKAAKKSGKKMVMKKAAKKRGK